jgi:uncharacterized membrane protein YbhN (UPF0104 family)
MRNKTLRSLIVVIILLATIAAFTWYFRNHPEVFQAIRRTPVATILVLFALYTLFLGTLIWIQRATLELCNLTLGVKESSLLVMYSSVINYFGPLQSGPAFRAAYLKAKHNVNLKRYAGATLAYYGLYALYSGLLLLGFVFGWWIILGCAAVYLLIPALLKLPRFQLLNKKHIRSLALATFSQVAVTTVIYFVAIHSLSASASFVQALAYTGAANFALFVSITPGAIGFREAFLVFSQKLHGVSNDVIAAASVIDRSVYIIFLLLLAIIVSAMHAREYFSVKK